MGRLSARCVLGCVLVLSSLPACGGVSRVERSGGEDETAGSSAAGANSAGLGGDSSAGSTSGGNGSAGANNGGQSACSRFSDEAPQNVTVRIRNDTATPVYLGSRTQSCNSTPLFEVRDASNTVRVEPGYCGTPCQGFLDGNPFGGCPAICLSTGVVKLSAGETIETQWAALYMIDTQLPSECDASHGSSTVSCSVSKRIEPGAYTFTARAGSDLLCDQGCGVCEPSGAGGCLVGGATVTGDAVVAELRVNLDEAYGVGSAGAANSGSIGQNRLIELVFQPLR